MHARGGTPVIEERTPAIEDQRGCWLFDLDGVVWLAGVPIPGSADAISRLVASGLRVAYFTNNSFPRRAEHLDKLQRFGLGASDDDLLTSSDAAAALCEPGEHALVLGGPGIREALERRGVDAHDASEARDGPFDVVLVGIDPDLDATRLARATAAIGRGARLVGTNDDPTFPTPDGPLPGGGAILAAVAYATGAVPIVAGKPHQPSVDLVMSRIGKPAVVVGDRPSTDGALARGLGARFALVLSGVTAPGHGPLDPEPDVEAADVASLVASALE
ncbi:MAG TPA: HAD-IIA family hydrolase [Acidimicrobiales bacterium]|nr:HAD-IIA family hydrolase [Acidimicrobiales bacterium]